MSPVRCQCVPRRTHKACMLHISTWHLSGLAGEGDTMQTMKRHSAPLCLLVGLTASQADYDPKTASVQQILALCIKQIMRDHHGLGDYLQY